MAEEQEQQNTRLEEIVYQGLGEASMCWSEIPKGVFDSEHAGRIGEEIMQAINSHPSPRKPFLSAYLFKAEIIAEIIKWGIRQNPYAGKLPRKTEIVVEKLNALLPDGMMEVEDIRHFISSLIEQVPEIREWNLSEREYQAGVPMDNEMRSICAFVSRYGSDLQPDHDFIDIDALKQNIIRSLEGKEE